MRFLFRVYSRADSATQGTADDRAIPAADLITDSRARGTPDTAADRRIHGGIVRGCIDNRQG
jgi:hypothetical protein